MKIFEWLKTENIIFIKIDENIGKYHKIAKKIIENIHFKKESNNQQDFQYLSSNWGWGTSMSLTAQEIDLNKVKPSSSCGCIIYTLHELYITLHITRIIVFDSVMLLWGSKL